MEPYPKSNWIPAVTAVLWCCALLATRCVLCSAAGTDAYLPGNPTNLPYPYKTSDGLWGYFRRDGSVLVEARFSYAGFFSEELACVSDKGGQYGVIDPTGRFVVPPRYRWLYWFRSGLACFHSDDGTYGFIDRAGKTVIEPRFREFGSFSQGICEAWLGEKTVIIDKLGRVLHSAKHIRDTYARHYDGLMKFQSNGKWGFLGPDGEVVIPAKFDQAGDFSERLAVVVEQGRTFVVGTNGQEALQLNTTLRRLGIIDAEKQDPLAVDRLWPFSDRFSGGLLACTDDDSLFFIDRDGVVHFRIPFGRFSYWAPQGFQGDVCVVLAEERPAEEQRGHVEIPPRKLSLLEEALLPLTLSDGVDTAPQEWQDSTPLTEPVARKTRSGVINRTGTFILPPAYDTVRFRPTVGYIISRDKRWGVLSENLKEIVPITFSEALFWGDLVRLRTDRVHEWLDPVDGSTVFSVCFVP